MGPRGQPGEPVSNVPSSSVSQTYTHLTVHAHLQSLAITQSQIWWSSWRILIVGLQMADEVNFPTTNFVAMLVLMWGTGSGLWEPFWCRLYPFFAAVWPWQPDGDHLHGMWLLHVNCLSMPVRAVYEPNTFSDLQVVVGQHLILSRGHILRGMCRAFVLPGLTWCLKMVVAMLSVFDSSRTLMWVCFSFQLIHNIYFASTSGGSTPGLWYAYSKWSHIKVWAR